MPVTFEILPIPIGSQFIQQIDSDDPADLNDFDILIVGDQNAHGGT